MGEFVLKKVTEGNCPAAAANGRDLTGNAHSTGHGTACQGASGRLKIGSNRASQPQKIVRA
jgi:hypothetical protein